MALKLTFYSNGGTNVPSIDNIDSGTIPYSVKPQDPTQEGYDFVGWYGDSGFTQAFQWESPLTQNKNLYARWIEHDDVTWYLNTCGRNDEVVTKWSSIWHDDSFLPVAPGMWTCLCGKTVNTIRFKVATPGLMTIKLMSQLTSGEVVATRTIDFSDAQVDEVVTKKFDDLQIGDLQVFSLFVSSDSGNIKYPTGVSNWNMKDGQFYSNVGGASPSNGNNVSLNIDVGFKYYEMIPVTRITLDKTSGNIAVGNSITINASVSPVDATNGIVNWVVASGTEFVSISPVKNSCTITGNAVGNATIKAIDADGRVEASYNLTVANMADVINHITFVSNGGSPVVGMTYQLNSPTFTLPSSTRSGYHFVGWFDNEMLIGDIKRTIPTGSFGDMTLYAKWVKQTTWEKYNGKTLTIMGDSNSTIYTKECIGGITYTQQICQQYGITENTMWFGQIAQALGMTITDRLNAANGLTIMNTTPGREYDCLANYRRLSWQKENGIDPGLIYIFAGFNDPLTHGGEIGTFDPTASYVTQLDKDTGVHESFVQAYVLMLTRIMDIYPTSEIVVICPYNFISNTDSRAYSTEVENTQIKAICQYFNIKCIDANDFGVNRGTWPFWPEHQDDDTFDGTHPVNQGFAKIANAVIANMDDGIKVEGISIDKPQTRVSVGGHTFIKAQVLPENATNQNVSYRIVSGSDKISIEQIGQRCQITGLEIGSAVIEAMSENGGKTMTCEIQVLSETNIPYRHIKKEDGTKIQVDSAIRDGSGRKIETKYIRTINGVEPENGNVDISAFTSTSVGLSSNGNSVFINENVVATKTWVNNQNYLTSHQSLSDYVKIADVDAIHNKLSGYVYDLNADGEFTRLVIDLAKSMGAVVMNSPVEEKTPLKYANGNTTKYGNI